MKKHVLLSILTLGLITISPSMIDAQNTAQMYKEPESYDIQEFNNEIDLEPSTTGSQIIVKYHDDFNPEYLQDVVDKRSEQRSSLLGSIFLFIQNVRNSLAGNETPEVHLSRIESVDNNVELVSKTALSTDPSSLQYGMYLVTLEPESTVEDVITLYEALPEVEYAQPNNTYYYDFE